MLSHADPPRPTVSILVPVFNRADLVAACLESALAQTAGDLEVVVVDGASTDDTWEVCQRIAASDPRVRAFRDAENTGPVRGWLRCLDEARGTYATFLWSDDLLMPTFLEATMPFLADEQVGFAFTAAEIGPEPGQGEVHYVHPPGLMPSETFIRGSLAGDGDLPVSPACALFRLPDLRESFTMELPTDPAFDMTANGAGVDMLLFILTASRYPFVACRSDALAFFRSHPGSLTIDDRGGRVSLGYAVTRSWFMDRVGDRTGSRAILARHWIGEMRSSRRFVSPMTAARRYANVQGPVPLTVAAMRDLVGRVAARLASAVRR